MRLVYSPRYQLSLPGHIWPTDKYAKIAARLRAPTANERGELNSPAFVEPVEASWEDLALVHSPEYLHRLRTDTLTPHEIATLELPWSAPLADGFRLMVGGTCLAARFALEDGAAAHIGGGLHHAFANHGEGFCPLNDIAVAIRGLQRDGALRRAAVVDCDVHHGNGTAMIFEGDPGVFTFSIHQQHNYPLFKPRSDLDIGLENRAGDRRYLSALAGALPQVLARRPDLVVYVAGADPFEHDQLGGLRLTKAGLAERDRMVIDAARAAGAAIVVVLAGGYAYRVEDTVDIHAATLQILASARSPGSGVP